MACMAVEESSCLPLCLKGCKTCSPQSNVVVLVHNDVMMSLHHLRTTSGCHASWLHSIHWQTWAITDQHKELQIVMQWEMTNILGAHMMAYHLKSMELYCQYSAHVFLASKVWVSQQHSHFAINPWAFVYPWAWTSYLDSVFLLTILRNKVN